MQISIGPMYACVTIRELAMQSSMIEISLRVQVLTEEQCFPALILALIFGICGKEPKSSPHRLRAEQRKTMGQTRDQRLSPQSPSSPPIEELFDRTGGEIFACLYRGTYFHRVGIIFKYDFTPDKSEKQRYGEPDCSHSQWYDNENDHREKPQSNNNLIQSVHDASFLRARFLIRTFAKNVSPMELKTNRASPYRDPGIFAQSSP